MLVLPALGGAVALTVASASGPNKPHPTHKPTPIPSASPSQTYGASVLFALDWPDRDTDAAVAAGLNTIRIVNFLDEGPAGDPYDAWRWGRVDTLIAAAKARGLGVILDLSTYRNQLIAKGLDPYTQDWGPWLGWVANRYRAETAVKVVALAGEPNGTDPALVSFYQRSIPQYTDSAKVVESGGLLGYSGATPWQGVFDAVHYCSIHVYSQADIDYLPTIDAWCDSRGYPLLLEEFGEPQSVGDTNRAAYFAAMYDRARTMDAGVAFWNLGPQLQTDTYDVNTNTPATYGVVQQYAP